VGTGVVGVPGSVGGVGVGDVGVGDVGVEGDPEDVLLPY
jgi:hypothetical protein